jgi:uncharacterized membrane protein YdjX (TVP38/TMEM64 family)
MTRKIATLAAFLLLVWIGYTQKDLFIHWIQQGGILAVVTGILFVALTALFPVMPFVAVAGLIGAAYGIWLGALISLAGALLGASMIFALSRFGFRDSLQRYLNRHPKAKEYEESFENHAFLTILTLRLIPVVPSPVVNILSGITRVPWTTFLLASLIGKMPTIVIFSFIGSRFEESKTTSFITYGLYMVVMMAAAFFYLRKRERSKA